MRLTGIPGRIQRMPVKMKAMGWVKSSGPAAPAMISSSSRRPGVDVGGDTFRGAGEQRVGVHEH